VNRFLTIRTISKGKSSGRPPASDEIVEDLKEMVEKTLQISGDKVFSIFICLDLFSYQFLYTVWWTMGVIIVPLLVLVLNNKYINVNRSKAQLKLVSG
jgi:hypothetical protein